MSLPEKSLLRRLRTSEWNCLDVLRSKRYIENAEVGSGLLIADKVVVPFNNTFPQDTELFRLMDTNPNSSKQKAPIKSL